MAVNSFLIWYLTILKRSFNSFLQYAVILEHSHQVRWQTLLLSADHASGVWLTMICSFDSEKGTLWLYTSQTKRVKASLWLSPENKSLQLNKPLCTMLGKRKMRLLIIRASVYQRSTFPSFLTFGVYCTNCSWSQSGMWHRPYSC